MAHKIKTVSKFQKGNRGFTFLEVMVTVVILSTGIVMIYKGLLLCLFYQKHLTYRAYAMNLLDHKMASLQYAYQQEDKIPVYEEGEIENIVLNNNNAIFNFKMYSRPLMSLPNIYEVDMILSWEERERDFKVSRSAYISKF